MEYVASSVRYAPEGFNQQWISYLNFTGEDGYPLIDDRVIVITNTGVFDAIVDDIDPANSGYLISYTAGPILETY